MSEIIYLDNKYTKTYYRIIDRALARPKPLEYTEKHHTIPKCAGGTETVVLTFKEHWICHHLLLKMVTGKLKAKMWLAFDRMGQFNGKNGRIINLKIFERTKLANILSCSGENAINYKRKVSKESRKKQSKSAKGNTNSVGRKLTEIHKKKLLEFNIGSKRTEETKRKMSLAKLGKKRGPYKEKF